MKLTKFMLSMMKKISLLIVALALLSVNIFLNSCATSSIGVQVLIPADITVPQHIQKVAVINHSLPAKENQKWNIIEGIFTGESIFGDREGAENCMSGLVNQLNSGPRFKAALVSNMDLRGTGTRQFPTPIDWNIVDGICKSMDVDALIALETFDSDFNYKKYTRNVTKKVENQDITVVEHYADMQVNVNAGWRIYDNTTKQIIDEKAFIDNKVFTAKGNDPNNALANLPQKRNAVNQAAVYAGSRFGVRISPAWRYENRQYYIGKANEFKQTRKYVEHNDWDMAIKIWEGMTTNPDTKIGGRACFNLGIAYEMKGDFETALAWMKKAYYDYNLKAASQYINILNRRIADRQRLDEQMGH